MTARPATPEQVGPEWSALLRLLPGYDPFRSTGGAWFDAERAERAIGFIEECLVHIEGKEAGKPFLLQPWEKSFVGNLFGWVKLAEDGSIVRRYREALLYVARKNGKTPLASAIALYILFCEPEAGQQNYIAAADREQAGKLFRHAKGMIEREPELASRCDLFGGRAEAGQSKSIVLKRDGSFIQVVSADANTKHGGNTHLVIIDELHAQKDRELVEVMTTSTASENRRQPLTLYLTTADYDRPSICNETLAEAKAARDAGPGGPGDNPAFLPAVYEVQKGEDWRDERVWEKANPNLGVSVSREYMRAKAKKSETNLPYRSAFLRLHLNMQTDSADGAIDLLLWDAMAGDVDGDELEGADCWGGLDLSSTTDLSALVLCFPREDGTVALRCRFWMPEETARRRSQEDHVPYLAWAEADLITLTDGAAIDHDQVRADINEECARYNVRAVGADPHNAVQLLIQLRGDGLPVERHGQGFTAMNPGMQTLLALTAEGLLRHGGHPVLRWMASKLMAEKDSTDKLKPSKKKSTGRIDGMVALAMGLSVWQADESNTGAGGVEVWA